MDKSGHWPVIGLRFVIKRKERRVTMDERGSIKRIREALYDFTLEEWREFARFVLGGLEVRLEVINEPLTYDLLLDVLVHSAKGACMGRTNDHELKYIYRQEVNRGKGYVSY